MTSKQSTFFWGGGVPRTGEKHWPSNNALNLASGQYRMRNVKWNISTKPEVKEWYNPESHMLRRSPTESPFPQPLVSII